MITTFLQFIETDKVFTYREQERTYKFFHRDLWDVAKKLITDPILKPYWSFDAIHLSKYDAETREWERFIDEPITADGMWDAFVSEFSFYR